MNRRLDAVGRVRGNAVAKWRMKEDTWRMTVAEIAAVLGGRKVLKRNVTSDTGLRVITREGLPVATLTRLAADLIIERKTLAAVVGISDRTLSRRIAKGERFSAEESDRVVRLARVVAMATDTLGTSAKASSWLQRPNMVLDGQTPLQLLDTDTGVRSVEEVLNRIEYGLYS
jgi:putative toxin-antitoxin system antitoxin component (TIGR02293 family)